MIYVFLTALALALAAPAQASPQLEVSIDTPLEEIVCEQVNNVDSCWQLGIRLHDSDPGKALKIMELSCAFGSQKGLFAGCYEAATTYLLDKEFVNYDRAYELFNAICFDDPDPGFAPYGCKYLGHMVQLGLGRPSNVLAAIDLFIRSCFNHNFFTDVEGCDLLASSYLSGFDWPDPGRSPSAIVLAFLSYARGCLVYPDGVVLCEKGAAFLHENRQDPVLIDFLTRCDRGHIPTEGKRWRCEEVFTRRSSLDFEFDQAQNGNFTTRYRAFWREEFDAYELWSSSWDR